MTPGTGLNARNVLTIQPDLASFRNLPYAPKSALIMGNLMSHQHTGEQSPLCTRSLLQWVVQDAKETHNIGFAVGVELEFCFMSCNNSTGDFADRSVFANSTSLNEQEEFLVDLYDQLKQQYIEIETIHAESGPGQLEVVLKYTTDPVEMADRVILAQETVRALAKKYGYRAIFLPKYDLTQAGNGMHVHMSIFDSTTGEPILGASSAATAAAAAAAAGGGLSSKGASFVEGLLQHLPGLMGLTMPTVNSFRRVGPGCWTGSQVGWALEDKESGVRVCSDLVTQEWNHVEVKLVDASCNIYLALAGLLSSGLDGIVHEMTLRPSLLDHDENVNDSSATASSPLPANAMEALQSLEKDDFLMKLMSPTMSQAYLVVRKHDAEASIANGTTLHDEVEAAYRRS
ncbi:MAG: hypothetical protein SGBAC_012423 [Bacillariaceae sp.]